VICCRSKCKPTLSGPLQADKCTRYYLHYHESFPILPDITTFLEHSNRCPLLFWTVMVIALIGKVEQRDLYFSLVDPIQTLASNITQPESRSFHAIQALLLLCCWPLPFGPTKNDPSHTFCVLATHNALRLGLHRPKHPSDFEYDAVIDEETLILRRKTWVACFIVNQR